jgi:hypothetical protein
MATVIPAAVYQRGVVISGINEEIVVAKSKWRGLSRISWYIWRQLVIRKRKLEKASAVGGWRLAKAMQASAAAAAKAPWLIAVAASQ